MRKTVTTLGLSFILAGSVWAGDGYHYIAKTMTTGTNLEQFDTMTVEGWVEGANAKIVFVEVGRAPLHLTASLDLTARSVTIDPTKTGRSREPGEANRFVKEGKYLLTDDGGETLYLVDPNKNTHAKLDLSGLFASAFMETAMVTRTVSNHTVEELASGDGPEMHGYDTAYHKYRTSYDLEIKVLGMKRADHCVIDNEIWSAEQLQATGFRAWMRPRGTGWEAVDALLAGELENLKGFPFKTVTVARTEGVKRKKRSASMTVTTEVIEFEAADVADSMFQLPKDSREISIGPLGATSAKGQEDEPKDI